MCYLKNLSLDESLDWGDLQSKSQETDREKNQSQANVLIPCQEKLAHPVWSQDQQMLVRIFQFVEMNNRVITEMTKSLKKCLDLNEKFSVKTENSTQNGNQFNEALKSQKTLYSTSTELTVLQKLFGIKKYSYALELIAEFPKILYKERNFQIELKLVDSSGNLVRNCNIVNLCCAVSTSEGEWIHYNKLGIPILKGKTEVELYKGETIFQKIYMRQVSRAYCEGKVNIVVYSKPTMLLCTDHSNSNINSENIRPLIIQGLVVKAKRKQ